MEPDKFDVGVLPAGVRFASAGCEAMPEEEGDAWREVRVCFIPVRRDFGKDGFGGRWGARVNNRLY